MSLKDALERRTLQQAAVAETEAYYQQMFKEAGMQGGSDLYQNTLPVKLSPEYQALIDEFVELCPPKAWQRTPAQADRKAASSRWTMGSLEAYYHGDAYIGQVKLSDGSVHINRSDMNFRLELGRRSDLVKRHFFPRAEEDEAYKVQLSGREKVLQDAQEKIDRWRRLQYGSGEYVRLTYVVAGSNCDWRYEVYIFREGTMYDLGYCGRKCHLDYGMYAPYKKAKNEFEKWLLTYL